LELVRPLGILYRRGKTLTSATTKFLELLRASTTAAVSRDRVIG
jgi:hypothetical protein